MRKIRFASIYLLTLAIVFFVLGTYLEWHFFHHNILIERTNDYFLLYPGIIHLIFFLIGFLTLISMYFLEKRESKILSIANKSLQIEIDERERIEKEREKLITELQNTLTEVKILRGIIPICSFCKQIRDDKGYWNQVEVYIKHNSEADFSHGVCPECMKKHYSEYCN